LGLAQDVLDVHHVAVAQLHDIALAYGSLRWISLVELVAKCLLVKVHGVVGHRPRKYFPHFTRQQALHQAKSLAKGE
jgi:hypothetical protein